MQIILFFFQSDLKIVPATRVTLGSHVHANTVILSFMFLKGLMMTSCKSKHVA
jgi:hypothetical protein